MERLKIYLIILLTIFSASLLAVVSNVIEKRGDDIIGFAVNQNPPTQIPAFPGAEGFGAETRGGRGGEVVFVDNLNDEGPGSLRNALTEINKPRIVMFRTSGVIYQMRRLQLDSSDSFVTVAGNTAPGDGIIIANYPIELENGFHDGVFRYVRVRTGANEPYVPTTQQNYASCDFPIEECNDFVQPAFSIKDAFNLRSGVSKVIIDHSSFSWAVDEAIAGGSNLEDITFQWSIIAEGSTEGHVEPDHSMGVFFAGPNMKRISFHHNYLANMRKRNPKFEAGDFRWINNVNYNMKDHNFELQTKDNFLEMDIINNYFKEGPLKDPSRDFIIVSGTAPGVPTPSFYISGNTAVDVNGNLLSYFNPLDQWSLVKRNADKEIIEANKRNSPKSTQPIFSITIESAEQAKDLVLANAGATLPKRDSVDTRIVNDFFSGTGSLGIRSGYPGLRSSQPPADSDNDGMPDSWETQFSLNPNLASDNILDSDNDGYTNLEEYIYNTQPTETQDAQQPQQYYRFENNICVLVELLLSEVTENDFVTRAECETNIIADSDELSYYRFVNNECSLVTLSQEERTTNDYVTRQECESFIVVEDAQAGEEESGGSGATANLQTEPEENLIERILALKDNEPELMWSIVIALASGSLIMLIIISKLLKRQRFYRNYEER
ncbi:hypothetical protein HY450_03040 [Candidatus Pacearchaeota archaeon]|nr:hypothetical protein [Candidatus Pacearchaeota archaeon]